MMNNRIIPAIERLETGIPSNKLRQSDAAEFVAGIPSLKRNRRRIRRLYANTLIDTRHMVVDITSDNFPAFHNRHSPIQVRMQMYEKYAITLTEKVVRKALRVTLSNRQEKQQLDEELVNSIDMVVIVSSTGFVAPGLDVELIERIGLRRNVARVTVNFMGCAAAMNGLRIASDHVRAYPSHKVLLVCVELSSINAVFADDPNDFIIHSIFGDGCAVAVIGASTQDEAQINGSVTIEDHFSYLVENTKDGIELGVLNNGITCKLSRQLPDYIENNLGNCINGFLDQQGLSKDNINLWAVHPGGPAIIRKAQKSLQLRDEQVADSWRILRRYGNILSPAVLFVMKRMLRRIKLKFDKQEEILDGSNQLFLKKQLVGLAFSFSPGVGVEGILFRKYLPQKSSILVAQPQYQKTSKSKLEELFIH